MLLSVQQGKVDVLFVAPERLAQESFLRVLPSLPQIRLVCVDECHCVAVGPQLSHFLLEPGASNLPSHPADCRARADGHCDAVEFERDFARVPRRF